MFASVPRWHGSALFGDPSSILIFSPFCSIIPEPFDPMEVLDAIREYVRHYLGCRECAGHFQQMAQYMELEVTRPEDVILWMWNGHNR